MKPIYEYPLIYRNLLGSFFFLKSLKNLRCFRSIYNNNISIVVVGRILIDDEIEFNHENLRGEDSDTNTWLLTADRHDHRVRKKRNIYRTEKKTFIWKRVRF